MHYACYIPDRLIMSWVSRNEGLAGQGNGRGAGRDCQGGHAMEAMEENPSFFPSSQCWK